MTPETSRLIDRTALVFGPLAAVVLAALLSGRTGDVSGAGPIGLVAVLLEALPWTAAWLAAALGFGAALRSLLRVDAAPAWLVAGALGSAALLFLDAALARLGLLGPAVAWTLVVIGVALLVLQLVRHPPTRTAPPRTAWLAAPAIAVLLVAAASMPGWLWDSEFGGFDALSYHLQLPREWLANGMVEPLAHNAYSHLPNYVESAFLHLAVLRGGVLEAAIACQLLHASFAVLTACATGHLAAKLIAGGADPGIARETAGVGFVIVLATPWVLVCGSLAYDELVVTFLLAAGFSLCAAGPGRPMITGAIIGFLAGIACGAKLTAAGFAAVPLAVALGFAYRGAALARTLAVAALAGGLALAPWLISNGAATGNPVFPFLAGALGSWSWTPEQLAIWETGHGGGLPIDERLGAAFNEMLRPGIGPAPADLGRAPWRAQWSLVPVAGCAALVVLAARSGTRRATLPLLACALVQIAFWICFTHVKGRFILPAVVPFAAAIAACTAFLPRSRAVRSAGPPALLLVALLPFVLFLQERNGMPAAFIDWPAGRTGDDMDETSRDAWGRVWPEVFVNHRLVAGARVLLVGEAAPLYFDLERIDYVTTWNRGRLAALMDEHPDQPAAWFDGLRDAGFTHVLVNPIMLEVWTDAGWNDPRLTAQAITAAAERHLRMVRRYETGIVVYALD